MQTQENAVLLSHNDFTTDQFEALEIVAKTLKRT
jgi:hypothetical protein